MNTSLLLEAKLLGAPWKTASVLDQPHQARRFLCLPKKLTQSPTANLYLSATQFVTMLI